MQGDPNYNQNYQQNQAYGQGYPMQAQYDQNGQPIGQTAAAYPPQYQAQPVNNSNQAIYSNVEVVSSHEHHKGEAARQTEDEVSDQMKFVRKVYSILAIQLTLTAVLIAMVQYD